MYRSAVRTQRFIADTTHLEIAYIVGVLARHLHNPAQRHFDALKHVCRYLFSRENHGLTSIQRRPLELTGYANSDYAADLEARRSVTGTIVFASEQPISWTSAKYRTETHSSTEAEYSAADIGTRTMAWLTNLADELKLPLETKTELRIGNKPESKNHNGFVILDTKNDIHSLVDKEGAFDATHAHGPSRRMKHLEVRYHYI